MGTLCRLFSFIFLLLCCLSAPVHSAGLWNPLYVEDGDYVANDAPLTIDFKPAWDSVCSCDVSQMSARWLCGSLSVNTTTDTTKYIFCNTKGPRLRIPSQSMAVCKGDTMSITFAGGGCEVQLDVKVNSDTISWVYVICSCISLCSSISMIYLYFRFRPLRQFPSNLMFWRALCDLIFNAQLVWINAWELSTTEGTGVECNSFVAFLTQATLLASLEWYVALALNFYFSISNPFNKPQSKVRLYHVVVWTTSVLTGLVVAFNHEYRPDYRLCWTPRTSGLNVLNWVLYFMWLIVFSVLSLFIVVWGVWKLRTHDMDATLKKRRQALEQTRSYAVIFSVYWLLAGALWSSVFFLNRHKQVIQQPALAYIFAAFAGLLGLVDSLTWLFAQGKSAKRIFGTELRGICPCIRAQTVQIVALLSPKSSQADLEMDEREREDITDEGDTEFEDISDALRFEYITNTSEGIRKSTSAISAVVASQDDWLPSVAAVDSGSKRVSIMGTSPASKHAPLLQNESPATHEMDVSVLRPNHQQDVSLDIELDDRAAKFVAYAPRSFAALRYIFSVSPRSFVASLSGDASAMSKNFSEGASGSFFYFTTDRKYLVKTLSNEEKTFLLSILPQYHQFMRDNRQSYICRFYGLYSVKMYGNDVYFVVMNNWLRVPPSAHPPYKINERYDLKGSSINRHTKPPPKGKVATRKDNDFTAVIMVKPGQAQRIKRQLRRDAQFMRDNNIMDYSLLIGIANVQTPYSYDFGGMDEKMDDDSIVDSVNSTASASVLTQRKRQPHHAVSAEVVAGPGIYHLGIIDVLQQWNYTKWAEQWAKRIFRFHCFDWRGISAVEPVYYAERFIKMTERIFARDPSTFVSTNRMSVDGATEDGRGPDSPSFSRGRGSVAPVGSLM